MFCSHWESVHVREPFKGDCQKNRHGRFYRLFPFNTARKIFISSLQGVWNVFEYSFTSLYLCLSLIHWGLWGTTVQQTTLYAEPETGGNNWKGGKVRKFLMNRGKYGSILTPAGNRKKVKKCPWKIVRLACMSMTNSVYLNCVFSAASFRWQHDSGKLPFIQIEQDVASNMKQ